MKKTRLAGLLGGALLLVLLLAPGTALAHERRTIANGKYDVVVGWNVEPPYAGQMNQATIRIMNAGTTTPVTGADKSLKLAIRQGASTQAFPLKPTSTDGFYTADIMPTRVGDYQWIFTGDINGDAVNETFDTADGKFDAVGEATAVQFPVPLGDPAANVAAVQAAQSDAQSARVLAVVGIVVGVLGLAIGVGAWLSRPRTASAPEPSTRPTSEPASERV
ncbi:MAG TPA: hypothetical protein VGK33_20485 [Chloroflexota bacterium]